MKLKSLSLLAAGGLLLASCGGNKTANPADQLFEPFDYTLTVTNIEGQDSAWLYLYDYDAMADGLSAAVIDSVMVQNGQGAFTVKGSKSPVAVIQAGKNGRQFLLFPQAGENTYNIAEGTGSGALNKAYKAYKDSTNSVLEHINLPEHNTMEYQAYVDSIDNLLAKIKDDALAANLENPMGFVIAIEELRNNPENVDSILAKAPHLANTLRMRKAVEFNENLKATSVGQPYTDFTIESPANGKTVKLSDYVKPGQYTLVDFWASWCGPCKRAIAALKKEYPALKEKGLNVVGITVWEDPDKTQAWFAEKPENAIPWDIVLDAQRVPTDLYAVSGIPTMILIGPDGKILARSYSDEEVVAAFNDAIAPAPAE